MTPTTPDADPIAVANRLASQFYAASRDVDNLRLSFDPPAPQDAHLRELSDGLESQAQRFTAAAVQATLAHLQPDLQQIEAATQAATAQLARLQAVDHAIQLASSLLGLGLALSAGDPSAALSATQGLLQLL